MNIFVALIIAKYSNQKKSQLLQREESDARNSYQVGKRLLTLFNQVVLSIKSQNFVNSILKYTKMIF